MRERQTHCASIDRRLSAYLDNELSPHLIAEVEKHLAKCPQCRKELVTQKRIWDSLAALSTPEPGKGLEMAVFRQIAKAEKPTHPRRLVLFPAGAAAVGLFLGIFLASNTLKEPDTPMAQNNGIMQALDVFSPSPKGSFSNAYFTMINDPGR